MDELMNEVARAPNERKRVDGKEEREEFFVVNGFF